MLDRGYPPYTKIELASDRRPWDRQETEKDEDWELFLLYQRERSSRVVAAMYFPEDKTEASQKFVSRICVRNLWVKRCRAYDRWLTETKDDAMKAAIQNEIQQNAKRSIQIINDLYQVARKAKEIVIPADAGKDHRIKLADAMAYTKIAQAALAEFRNLKADNADFSDADSAREDAELSNANQLLMKMMAERAEAEKQAAIEAASKSSPAASTTDSKPMLQ